MDAQGFRLQLYCEALTDLEESSLAYAINRWIDGDDSHMSEFERNGGRCGVQFPQVSDLRKLAKIHLEMQKPKDEPRNPVLDEMAAWRKHRAEHPEEYVTTAEFEAKLKALTRKIGIPAKKKKAKAAR